MQILIISFVYISLCRTSISSFLSRDKYECQETRPLQINRQSCWQICIHLLPICVVSRHFGILISFVDCIPSYRVREQTDGVEACRENTEERYLADDRPRARTQGPPFGAEDRRFPIVLFCSARYGGTLNPSP